MVGALPNGTRARNSQCGPRTVTEEQWCFELSVSTDAVATELLGLVQGLVGAPQGGTHAYSSISDTCIQPYSPVLGPGTHQTTRAQNEAALQAVIDSWPDTLQAGSVLGCESLQPIPPLTLRRSQNFSARTRPPLGVSSPLHARTPASGTAVAFSERRARESPVCHDPRPGPCLGASLSATSRST